MTNRQPANPPSLLEADADALFLGLARTITEEGEGEEPDWDIAAVIDRHGFDPLVDHLTTLGRRGIELVAHSRGTTPQTVVTDYLNVQVQWTHQPSDLKRAFRQLIRYGNRPRIIDPSHQQLFVLYLLGLRFMTVCELAGGKEPAGPTHRFPLPLVEGRRIPMTDDETSHPAGCDDDAGLPQRVPGQALTSRNLAAPEPAQPPLLDLGRLSLLPTGLPKDTPGGARTGAQ